MEHSLPESFASAEKNNDTESIVIGGAELIKQAIDSCDKLYLTNIQQDFDGDTFLDELSAQWKEIELITHAPDEKNTYTYSFVTYEK